MTPPVGHLTARYLARCGYKPEQIKEWSGCTRLLQDIGLTGDNAWDEFTLMHKEFGVDLTHFAMDRYFPSELSSDSLILNFLWRTPLAERVRQKYPEITLEMIERVLTVKAWPNGPAIFQKAGSAPKSRSR
jgi:hypothetical protein